jgi:beta-RFAP synthase
MNRQPSVIVIAPSRLHFGLLSFGIPTARQYGGVGAMIDEPSLQLRVEAADSFDVTGGLEQRVRQVASRWRESQGWTELPCCRIEITSAPRLHTGLGVGTQLALAVATALHTFHEIEMPSVAELAISLGRGLRSAVGTYGFERGGLIAEPGKLPDDPIAPLEERVPVPEDWRFVLVISQETQQGLSGRPEREAFGELPPVEPGVTNRLRHELTERMVPAVRGGRFAEFSESVYEYGRLAGQCFETIQGGPYHGAHLQQMVDRIRSLGVPGVGQSSWGPTIFAICPDASAGGDLRRELIRRGWASESEVVVAASNNAGVCVQVTDE